ncbi:MAG: cadherin-like domain-containing protein, partial [Anaerolineales bacterium]|nr:cadherin-like domain-containing protein [Anaerolineales bacterium]
ATDYEGRDTTLYQACLLAEPTNCDTALVFILVIPGIIIARDDVATLINTAVSGNVLANDLPLDQLTATAFTTITPAGGTFELTATGDFTYTPAADYEGLDEVSYEACWILNPSVCDTTVVAITVSNIYVVAIDDSVETEKNQDASGNVLDNDSGSGPISADPTLVAPAAHGNFALAEDGTFTYAPNTDYVGPDNVTYEVCLTDNEEICKEAIVSIEVVDPGGTLVAVDDDYEIEKNQPVSGNVLDNDISPDGELTASSDEFDLSSNGAFTYTPEADFVGTVTFNYQACLASDASKCDTAVVTIIVKDGDKPEDPVKHTVQKGEWLLQIARCYGTSPESIVHANHIRYPSWIMPGEVWVIPHVGDVSEPFNDGACIIGYKAEAGDTLESIADEYKVDLDMLVKANYGCYGYHSMYPNKQYGYDMHSPQIYSGCYFPTVPDVHEGQQLVIPVNNENKGLRP